MYIIFLILRLQVSWKDKTVPDEGCTGKGLLPRHTNFLMLNIADRSCGLAWRLRWWEHLPSVLLHWYLKIGQGSHCDVDIMFSLWQTIWGASFASDSGKQETGDLYPDKRVASVCGHQPESPVELLKRKSAQSWPSTTQGSTVPVALFLHRGPRRKAHRQRERGRKPDF